MKVGDLVWIGGKGLQRVGILGKWVNDSYPDDTTPERVYGGHYV